MFLDGLHGPAQPGRGLFIAQCCQYRLFFRRPQPALAGRVGNSKGQPSLEDHAERAPEPAGNFLVGDFAQEPVFPRLPVNGPQLARLAGRDSQFSAAITDLPSGSPQARCDFDIGPRAEEVVLFFGPDPDFGIGHVNAEFQPSGANAVERVSGAFDNLGVGHFAEKLLVRGSPRYGFGIAGWQTKFLALELYSGQSAAGPRRHFFVRDFTQKGAFGGRPGSGLRKAVKRRYAQSLALAFDGFDRSVQVWRLRNQEIFRAAQFLIWTRACSAGSQWMEFRAACDAM